MPKILNYPAKQRLEVLAKEYITTEDICILCQCGRTSANQYRKKYKDWLASNSIKVFDNGKVDTDLFVRFSNEALDVPSINTKRIEKFAKLEVGC